MKIKYEFLTGEIVEVEVADDIGEISVGIDQSTHNSDRGETRRHHSFDALLEQGIQIATAQREVSADIESEETMESLYYALDKLLPQQRNLVQMIFFEGQSVSEIARMEGVSEGAIRNRLRKIYEKLKIFFK